MTTRPWRSGWCGRGAPDWSHARCTGHSPVHGYPCACECHEEREEAVILNESRLTMFPDVEQHSDEWYEQRRGIVTASVVGQLLTPTLKVADNDTSRSLTALLVAERITGHIEPTYTSDDMWRGIEAEPYARERYAETRGVEVEQVGFMVRDLGGCQIGYSPDGLVGDDGLIEIKAPRAKNHLRTILAGEVPAQHMAQLQAALLVSGREWVDFVSWYGGMPMWVQRVTPDPKAAESIADAVRAFEEAAGQMALAYGTATEGLPMTERIEVEMVI